MNEQVNQSKLRGHRLSDSESLYYGCDLYTVQDNFPEPLTPKEYGMKLQKKKNRRRRRNFR